MEKREEKRKTEIKKDEARRQGLKENESHCAPYPYVFLFFF